MYAMCKAGIPVVDVFPVTGAYPTKPEDGIHFPMETLKSMQNILEKYFEYL